MEIYYRPRFTQCSSRCRDTSSIQSTPTQTFSWNDTCAVSFYNNPISPFNRGMSVLQRHSHTMPTSSRRQACMWRTFSQFNYTDRSGWGRKTTNFGLETILLVLDAIWPRGVAELIALSTLFDSSFLLSLNICVYIFHLRLQFRLINWRMVRPGWDSKFNQTRWIRFVRSA